MIRRKLALTLLIIAGAGSACADIHMVWPEGHGEYANIQAAIDASAQNDTIMLIEGWFTGPGNRNLQIPGSRTFIGFGEPGSNVIDAEGEPLGAMVDDDDPYDEIVFEGITFRNGSRFTANSDDISFERCRFENCERVIHVYGYISTAGSVQMTDCVISACQDGPLISANSVGLLRCNVKNNINPAGGGASIATGYGISAEECTFLGNGDDGNNTTLLLAWGTITHPSGLVVSDCEFIGNAVSYGVSSIYGNSLIERCRFEYNLMHGLDLYGVEPTPGHLAEVRDCVFVENQGAAILIGEVSMELEGCTFVKNGSLAEIVDSSDSAGSHLEIDRCLFAFRTAGSALLLQNEPPTLQVSCTDIFGVPNGWGGPLAPWAGLNGNLDVDPLFCDWMAGDLTLFDISPCMPPNNSCGVRIGALGGGCVDLTSVEAAPGFEARLSAQPNPFNPSVRLRFALDEAGPVHLTVHDLSGRRVAMPLDGAKLSPGDHHVDWSAAGLPSGVYFARLRASGQSGEVKLVLLR